MANPLPAPSPPESPGGKSAEAFRTISEVAAALDLPQHVLRFWETRFAVIRPLKRSGGRRYYRPEDVALLRRIRDLLREKGYTIKGVQKLLRQGGERAAETEMAAEAPNALDPPAARGLARVAPGGAPTYDAGFAGGRTTVAEAPDATPVNTDSAEPGNGADEAPLLFPTAREDLEAVLAELEALRALVKTR